AQPEFDRASRGSEVGERLAQLAEPRAVEDLRCPLLRGIRGELLRVLALELRGEIAQQALADELKQHVVVTLEGGIHVEVVVQADETVLGEEPLTTARLARLLDRVERVPGRQRLERGREGLQVLASLIGVLLAAEHHIELAEQLVVAEGLRVGRRDTRDEAAAVLAVVEQHRLTARAVVELTPLVTVGDRDLEGERGSPRSGAVERDSTLHERAEHREEATPRAR